MARPTVQQLVYLSLGLILLVPLLMWWGVGIDHAIIPLSGVLGMWLGYLLR